LVVGLGNPEQRYARSRHNAGQMVVEALAERLGARWRSRYRGRYAEARGPAGPLALLVPTTYMNLSGDSVGPA
jgi:PTH1 family peptidyl-tRNA hydrolase